MKDKVTDLRWTAATLRRRRRVLAASALVGLAAGVGYVMVEPPPLTSTTLVLLPTPAIAESSNSDVATQVTIAFSASILGEAGQALDPPLPVRTVERMVEVSASTDQLIKIEATSTRAAEAQTLSQAVADSYVGFVSGTAREVSAAALADLKIRRDALQEQIKQLQGEIAATRKRQQAVDPKSTEASEEAQLLARLRSEQANLSLQLDKVQDKIATNAPAGSSAAGTSVVQPATEATGPSTGVRLLEWASFGALVCAILAVVIVLATARRDPRVRLRDEIADAIGSPVLAAVRSRPARSVAGWRTLLKTYEASPVESWAFRQLLRGLLPADPTGDPRPAGNFSHPQSITVVSLAGDGRGLAIGPQLASFASSVGISTQLATSEGHARAETLWAACAADRTVEVRPHLFVGDVSHREAIDLTIILVVVDRREPALGDGLASAATILSVTAGAASEQELARVAVAVDDTGRRIDGIVVADPDPTDRTSGRHTMDERSDQLALPMRLTGIATPEGAARDRPRSRP